MLFRTLIGAASLLKLLGEPRLALVDCRFDLMNPGAGREAYLREHIPGASYADLNHDLSAPIGPDTGRHPLPAPGIFADRLGRLGIGNDSQVVAYDEVNGSFAARLWWMLRWLGHDRVAVLDGGFKAWTAIGGAVASGPSSVTRQQFRLRTGAPAASGAAAAAGAPAAMLSTAQVEQALRHGRIMLIDARARERYAGEVEPIDAAAGHIPGAVNHPFTANLDTDGRFLPADELERRWRERLAGGSPGNLVAMCGSGVTACHNLLSLEIAGLTGGKLYAGSWSEWIRDPRRPIARGNDP
jgi:thiosulfate/3-mercaptopyruvate sulfurtransferase